MIALTTRALSFMGKGCWRHPYPSASRVINTATPLVTVRK